MKPVYVLLPILVVLAIGGFAIDAFGFETHDPINEEALPFLRTEIINEINDGNTSQDSLYPGQTTSEWHFDDCMFEESTIFMNSKIDDVLALADPQNGPEEYAEAANEWGKMLHPAQDFYSHANWIDSGKTGLVDSNFSKWAILTPYSSVGGLIVVQGEDASIKNHGYLKAENDGLQVKLFKNPHTHVPGLISGTTYITDDCPDSIAIGHWDMAWPSKGNWPLVSSLTSWIFGTDPGLNKDNPNRNNFKEAKRLAVEQTEHDWCRLLNIVHGQQGLTGAIALYEHWVEDKPKADAACDGKLSFIPF